MENLWASDPFVTTRAHPRGFSSEWYARLAEADQIIAEMERELAASKELKPDTRREVNNEITRLVAVLANIISR